MEYPLRNGHVDVVNVTVQSASSVGLQHVGELLELDELELLELDDELLELLELDELDGLELGGGQIYVRPKCTVVVEPHVPNVSFGESPR